jgi:hypothetical protein
LADAARFSMSLNSTFWNLLPSSMAGPVKVK